MLAASKGAKGLRRFMTLGKDMLSQAPAATGASTTCKHILQMPCFERCHAYSYWQAAGVQEGFSLSLMSDCKTSSHHCSS